MPGLPKYAARRDTNEREIVIVLRTVGAQVYRLSAPGLPDLIVNHDGKTTFLEVKARRGEMTAAQRETLRFWEGAPVHVVRSPDEAVRLFESESK